MLPECVRPVDRVVELLRVVLEVAGTSDAPPSGMRHDIQGYGNIGWLLFVVAVAAGCGDGTGSVTDDASPADASPADASPADASSVSDAGMDAGDAGVAPVIVDPPDGAMLRARRQTFTWTDTGSDYRLRVGTTPGAADLYESPPLGDATSVTVDGLPLSGVTIYAQLLSGPEDATVSSINTYQAPMRRGLCVIVDFADRHLEDHAGAGMKSVADVAAQLAEMEAHWDWLSRGLEKMQWDIVRVQLTQEMTDTAFPGWWAFRDEVVLLTKEQVSLADYDVDSDDVLDTIWAIVANGDTELPYVIGGASQNQGAGIFVDGQASFSVQVGATGNFNHELGHTAGRLPDLYGPYSTIGDLSLMSSSWPLPPNDFTAFERTLLGWVDPLVIDETTADVVVPNADDHMFAIEIAAPHPDEYFLIEYRKRPDSGYGSSGAFHDGLAVYHVWRASHQHANPPLLKLEPADGAILPDSFPQETDFVSPENPALQLPMVLRSYFTARPVFQIDRVSRTADGAIEIDLSVAPELPSNYVVNGSVEESTAGWSARGLAPDQASFSWASIGWEGTRSLSLSSPTDNDVEWTTQVTDLVPGLSYFVCGWLKTVDVVGGAGATMSLSGTSIHSPSLHGTTEDWIERCIVWNASETSLDLACRLGGDGALTRGQMWCDDVSVRVIANAFPGWSSPFAARVTAGAGAPRCTVRTRRPPR